MSDQVPPPDGVEPGDTGEKPSVPPVPPQWNADELNDVGDLHGYLPYDPPPLGSPVPPPPGTMPVDANTPPMPPPPAWGTPGVQPPQAWGSPGAQPPTEWGGPAAPTPPAAPSPPSIPTVSGWSPAPTSGIYPGAPIQFGVIPLRPLGLGEMIEGTFKTFRRYPGPIFTFGVILALIQSLILATFFPLLNRSHLLDHLQKIVDHRPESLPTHWSDYSDVPLSWFAGWYVALILVAAVTLLVGALAYSHVAGEATIGTSLTGGELWKLTRRQLWRGIGMFVLLFCIYTGVALLFMLVALFASILPTVGPILSALTILALIVVLIGLNIRLYLAPATLALEDVGPLTAIRRSARLVRGSWWRVFGYLIVAGLIAGAISFAVALPFNFFAGLASTSQVAPGTTTNLFASFDTTSVFLQLLGNVVATAATLPFSYIFAALLYTDLRMRKENLATVLMTAAQKRHR